MIFIEAPQGMPEWDAARCGRITASRFTDAVSTVGGLTAQQQQYVDQVLSGAAPKDAALAAGYKAPPTADTVRHALLGERTEEFSDTARRYAADLAIEQISIQPHGEPVKAWVLERGHTMEEIARRQYEARTGSFVTEAGICITDDGKFGYSTDGLVDADGLIEIKAPIDSIKILAMLNTGDTSEYDHQMQGGMWITGRAWCDFIMYVPGLAAVGRDLFVKRIYRDEAFIAAMVAQLVLFDGLVRETREIFIGVEIFDGSDVIEAPDGVGQQIVDAVINAAHVEALLLDLQFDIDVAEAAALLPRLVVLSAEDAEFDAAHGGRDLLPVEQVAHEAAGARHFEVVRTPPTLRLGQITARLGFTLTADFLRTLGFEPAARDKAAQLYHERHFDDICVALIRHIDLARAEAA